MQDMGEYKIYIGYTSQLKINKCLTSASLGQANPQFMLSGFLSESAG